MQKFLVGFCALRKKMRFDTLPAIILIKYQTTYFVIFNAYSYK